MSDPTKEPSGGRKRFRSIQVYRGDSIMRTFLLAGVTALTLTGVSVPASHAQDALGGAIVGGATGAAIGGAVGGGRGAAVGAGVGAVTGAAVGANAGERRAYRGSRAEYVV